GAHPGAGDGSRLEPLGGRKPARAQVGTRFVPCCRRRVHQARGGVKTHEPIGESAALPIQCSAPRSDDRGRGLRLASLEVFDMKRLLFGALLMSVASVPAMAALKTGDSAPRFTAPASRAGKAFTFSLKKALKKGPVVVYFYPSAYTGGCDLEAHTFAQDSAKFAAAGATIIGVSLDSIQRLNAFSADPKYCAGKFPTASDAGGAISKSYEVAVAQGQAGLKDVRGIEIG